LLAKGVTGLLMTEGSLSRPSVEESDFFSDERSLFAAGAWARSEESTRLRHKLEPLAEKAHRLACDLDGGKRREAEDLRDAIRSLMRQAE
jgi:hypothetical protein